jgi:hypothetical protein
VRPEPTFAVSLITADGRPPSAAAKAFIDLVLASYPAPGAGAGAENAVQPVQGHIAIAGGQ